MTQEEEDVARTKKDGEMLTGTDRVRKGSEEPLMASRLETRWRLREKIDDILEKGRRR